jgi:pilus assembly protein CpaE
VNIALQQAMEQPERTALFDLNLTFGHAAAMLGLEPEVSLADVPAENLADFDRRTLGRFMVGHDSGLQVLVAGTRPEEGEVVTAAHVRAALSTMKRQFSAAIVDCGTSFDEPTIAALEMADRIIVVCTPELNTLRDVRECLRVFGEIIHLDGDRLCFVFNHYQPFAVLAREQFETALEQPMELEIPHAGEAAHKAAAKGEPLVRSASGLAFSRAIEKLTKSLIPAEPRSSRKVGLSGQSGGLLGILRGKRAS